MEPELTSYSSFRNKVLRPVRKILLEAVIHGPRRREVKTR